MSNRTNFSSLLFTSRSGSFALGLFLIPIAVLGTGGSIICLDILWKKEGKLRSSADSLFANMCATSLLMSGIVAPIHSYSAIVGPFNILRTLPYDPLCQCTAFLFVLLTSASPFTHLAVAINRFFFVVHGHYYFSKSKVCEIALIALPWCLALLCSVWPLFRIGGVYGFNLENNRCSSLTKETSIGYLLFLRSIAPCISAPLMIFCYWAVFAKVARIKAKVKTHRVRSVMPTANKIQPRSEMRVTKISSLSCGFFLAMFLPTALYSVTTHQPIALRTGISTYLLMISWIGMGVVIPTRFVFITSGQAPRFLY